ncbi:hypothetical protein IIB79_08190 [candidate division KSB1 bacterium]|nr:hypothetical protein [candidate division KSB1 bacterium]
MVVEAGGNVSWSLEEFNLGGKSYPIGSFVVESGSISFISCVKFHLKPTFK